MNDMHHKEQDADSALTSGRDILWTNEWYT